MELWLDTIDYSLIENALKKITITGITTNPSILSKSKESREKIINRLLAIQSGFVAVQVNENDINAMLTEAKILSKISDRIIIKVPIYQKGLVVMKQLASENIPIMSTAIFETSQIYLSMLADAKYAAPYFGKIEQNYENSDGIIQDMLQVIKNYNSNLKILAASIKTKQQILNCLLRGVHAITLSEKAYHELVFDHDETIQHIAHFEKDWNERCVSIEK